MKLDEVKASLQPSLSKIAPGATVATQLIDTREAENISHSPRQFFTSDRVKDDYER